MQRVVFPNKVLPYLLVAPQIVLTIVFFFWPASQALYQSVIREDPFGLKSGFVGFANFSAVLSDANYLNSLKVTVVFSVLTALLAMGVALLLATAADRVVRGKTFYRTLLIWPYAVAPAVAGMGACPPSSITRRFIVGAHWEAIRRPISVEPVKLMADYFAERGFAIDRFTCLGLTDDREMARISPKEIVAFAKDAAAPESDALFISCTAVRAAGVIAEIEQAIGKAVVSSNYATAWACLRLCGDREARPQLGRLMELPFEGERP